MIRVWGRGQFLPQGFYFSTTLVSRLDSFLLIVVYIIVDVMKKILLLIVSVFLLFTGCTNPTHIYHPLDYPEQSKGEVVKYEGAQIKIKWNDIAYESKVSDSLMLFRANRFCYDPQNDYFVFPKSKDALSNETGDGLYFIVPKDNVTLCKNAVVKNNSYFSRNHMVNGAVVGGAFLGAIGAVGALAMAPLFLFLSNGGSASLLIWGTTGAGVVIGSAIGFTVNSAIHSEKLIDDIKETCDAYYTEEELNYYLERNLCF